MPSNPFITDGVQSPQSIFEASTTKYHALGTRGTLPNGSVFYYAKNAGAAITLGNLCRIAAPTGNHNSVAWQSLGASNTSTIALTLGATSAAENLYQDGTLIAIDGTASGQKRTIVTHTSASSGGVMTVTVADPFTISAASGDEFSLLKNDYDSVVVTPGNAVVAVAGVPAFTVPAGSTDAQYFWIQTSGPALVVADNTTFASGGGFSVATATTDDAGQMTVIISTTSSANAVPQIMLGTVIDDGDASSDGDHMYVNLNIRS